MKKAVWIFGAVMALAAGAYCWVQGNFGDRQLEPAPSLTEGLRNNADLAESESPEEVKGSFVPELLVVDLNELPVAGVKLSLKTWQGRWRHEAIGVGSEEALKIFWTDENGIAKCEGLTPGSHQLVAEHQGQWGFAAVWVPDPDADLSLLKEGSRAKIVLSNYKRLVIEIVGPKGKGVSDAIVVVVDPDSEEMPDSRCLEFNGGALLSFVTDSTGKIELFTKPQERYGLHRAKRLRVTMLLYGADFPQRTFNLEEHEGTLKLEAPETVALTFLARQLGGGEIEGSTQLFWTSGAKSPLGLRGHMRFRAEARKSKMAKHYLWNWSLMVPPEGLRVRAFLPNSEITTFLRHREYLGRQQRHQLGPDAEQTLNLTTGPAKSRLRLKLVDEFGEPIPFSKFTYKLTNSEGPKTRLRFESADQSGSYCQELCFRI